MQTQGAICALLQQGAIQTVFNPFPRRHLEPSPSECGRQGGPSHTTQKPSGICPPGTHARQNEVVCDRRALNYRNTYVELKKIQLYGQIVSSRKYIPHSQSSLNVFVCMYIPHSRCKENVCARWRNTNSFQEKVMCDCSLIQLGLFLETVCIA